MLHWKQPVQFNLSVSAADTASAFSQQGMPSDLVCLAKDHSCCFMFA